MPRGRHRYTPPRRLVIPAALGVAAVGTAGAALVTAELDSWVPGLFIVLTASAALTATLLMRRRDADADRRIGRERTARNTFSALADEREAELTELRERVTELEDRLQAKRIDLRRLRSEHADLLRRYAHSEEGRARALEGRRQLALEAAEPTRALPAGPADHRTSGGAPTALTYLQAGHALQNLARNVARQRGPRVPAPTPQAVPRPGGGNRQIGGFDFFGHQGGAGPSRTSPPEQGHSSQVTTRPGAGTPTPGSGAVPGGVPAG